MRKIYPFLIQKYKQLLLFFIATFAFLALYGQGCTLTATTSGYNAAYNQIYVLTDNTGIILDQNTTGTFVTATTGTYFVHALNYDPLDPPNPLPAAIVGASIGDIGSISAACYNTDFLTDNKEIRCGCETFCAGSTVSVSSLGYNTNYAQVYVLADSLGIILAVNNSGNFTTDVSANHTYNIYALNYNLTDPPIPFPVFGGNVAGVGDLTPGCMNSDFLSDVYCINVTTCNTCQQSTNILQGDSYTSDCAGFANGLYNQLYYLVDSAGIVVAISTSGTFVYNYPVGSNYKIYALNYNLSEQPIPMPTTGDMITTLGSISSGCYNQDFFSDFVCMKVINLIPLPSNELSLVGRKSADKNILEWKVNTNTGSDYFELQRSENGTQFSTITQKQGLEVSNTQQSYTYTDSFPLQTKNYYRVRERNLDGNTYVSNVVLLQNTQMVSTQVFPNPFKNELSVLVEGENGTVYFFLYNDLGQNIFHTNWEVDRTMNEHTISTAALSSGIYFYKIIYGENTSSGKIVKIAK